MIYLVKKILRSLANAIKYRWHIHRLRRWNDRQLDIHTSYSCGLTLMKYLCPDYERAQQKINYHYDALEVLSKARKHV